MIQKVVAHKQDIGVFLAIVILWCHATSFDVQRQCDV